MKRDIMLYLEDYELEFLQSEGRLKHGFSMMRDHKTSAARHAVVLTYPLEPIVLRHVIYRCLANAGGAPCEHEGACGRGTDSRRLKGCTAYRIVE